MQSMTTGAIQQAWDELRDGQEMSDLSDAAKCRSESDWLVGLNSTRALTCFRSRHGGFNITAAGRVQTPTLAILAKRENEIAAFTATPYAEVHGLFRVDAGEYDGKWVDLDFKKDETNPHGRAERIWDKERARVITERCLNKTGIVTEDKKPTKQIAPQLYDLTTLQREAPFTAKNTLGLAQTLYERHKMITYPRTDSRYLPEDYMSNVKEIVTELAGSSSDLANWAQDALDNDRLQFQKRIFNNAKVSDHFAIIPTGRVVKIDEPVSKLYDMIVKRFLAVFFPHAEFEVTKRLTTIDHGAEKDTFRTDGKILITPGWLSVYGRKPGVAAGKDELCTVHDGEDAQAIEITMEEKETNPPPRYTESTLLSAMEGAGKLIDDDELREAMSERGLGTPATRAATIEGLIRQKYLTRDGRELIATGKGVRLINLLQQMDIKPLTSPSMTGDWEAKLRKMEQGELDRATFMSEIARFTKDAVGKARAHYDEIISRPFPDLQCPCPNCGATELKQTDATYECRTPDCGFRISKYIAGRAISEEEAKTLFTTKFLETRDGFVSRFNRPFEAALELKQQVSKTGKLGKWKTNFVFDSDLESVEDLTDDQMIKELTLTNGKLAKLYETEKAFMVPALTTKDNPDGFRLGKTILQKELTAADVEKMLVEGKTALLPGFISKKTKRAFAAHLTLDLETAKIGFEFAPRAKKAARKATKKVAKEKEEES